MVVCLPTGAGKTVVFAHLARLAKRSVVVIAHREELLSQAREKLVRVLGDDVSVSVERGEQRAESTAKVVVCSVRSLRTDRLARVMAGREPGLVIYDECHHAAAEDNLRVLREIGCFEPDWPGTLVGFTATTMRGDGRGLDEVFEEIVYSKSLVEMVEEGFLVPLRGYRVNTGVALTRVGVEEGDGDLREEELAEVVNVVERNALVARAIQELARDRRTVVFCVTVAHAVNLCKSLGVLGVRAAVVHGALPLETRAKVLRDFAEGRVTVVTNVGVLTEGFDDPGVSCVAMARPTRSAGLYAQCVGRGTRLFEGKRDCVVIDFVDASVMSLCVLPTLFGMPGGVDLEGRDVCEVKRLIEGFEFDHAGFEVEAGEITLDEVKTRAEVFDPLTLRVDREVSAVSENAWSSLGRYGLVLHFERERGVLTKVMVRDVGESGRGRRWEVSVDGAVMERFSTVEAAVEAVDYEVERRGRAVARSAKREAGWRRERVSGERVEEMVRQRVGRTRAVSVGELVVLEAWAEVLRQRVKKTERK